MEPTIEYNLGKLVVLWNSMRNATLLLQEWSYTPYPYLFFTSLFTLQPFILHWNIIYYLCCDSFRDTVAKSSFFEFLFLFRLLCNIEIEFSMLCRSCLVIHFKYIRGFFSFVFLSSQLIIRT